MVPSPPAHPHARTSAIALCVTLSVMLGACGSHGADTVGTEVGTIQLALTALGSDGATYRLRRGTLDIQGPSPSSVDLGKLSSSEVAFQSKVPVGEYTITLLDGWTLQRADGEHYVDVSAELLSTNPTIVDVKPDAVAVGNGTAVGLGEWQRGAYTRRVDLAFGVHRFGSLQELQWSCVHRTHRFIDRPRGA